MADEHNKESIGEVTDRGLFNLTGKREEKSQEDALVTGVEKLSVEEDISEKKEEGLLHKLHRSHSSSSSSSSDEEEEEVEGPDGEKIKKKKKKGFGEKIKEKLSGDKKEEEVATVVVTEEVIIAPPVAGQPEDAPVIIEKIEETVMVEAAPEEEKKGFLEKIKEKLPGQGPKKETSSTTAAPVSTTAPAAAEEAVEGGEVQEGKEKKGILGKIMEKLPGYHKDEKDHETH